MVCECGTPHAWGVRLRGRPYGLSCGRREGAQIAFMCRTQMDFPHPATEAAPERTGSHGTNIPRECVGNWTTLGSRSRRLSVLASHSRQLICASRLQIPVVGRSMALPRHLDCVGSTKKLGHATKGRTGCTRQGEKSTAQEKKLTRNDCEFSLKEVEHLYGSRELVRVWWYLEVNYLPE